MHLMNGMIAHISTSEPGTLLLLGSSLLATSLILRWVLTTVVRSLGSEAKANLPTQESPVK
jgi:hypothetical protein